MALEEGGLRSGAVRSLCQWAPWVLCAVGVIALLLAFYVLSPGRVRLEVGIGGLGSLALGLAWLWRRLCGDGRDSEELDALREELRLLRGSMSANGSSPPPLLPPISCAQASLGPMGPGAGTLEPGTDEMAAFHAFGADLPTSGSPTVFGTGAPPGVPPLLGAPATQGLVGGMGGLGVLPQPHAPLAGGSPGRQLCAKVVREALETAHNARSLDPWWPKRFWAVVNDMDSRGSSTRA